MSYKKRYVKLPMWQSDPPLRQRTPSWGPLAGAVSNAGTCGSWGRILRYFSIFQILGTLLLAGCVTGTPAIRQPAPEAARGVTTLRIDNRNWRSGGAARVYIFSAAGGYPVRVATLSSLSQEAVTRRITFPLFRLRVTFLASDAEWVSYRAWSNEERCLLLTIRNQLTRSDVMPCWRDDR